MNKHIFALMIAAALGVAHAADMKPATVDTPVAAVAEAKTVESKSVEATKQVSHKKAKKEKSVKKAAPKSAEPEAPKAAVEPATK